MAQPIAFPEQNTIFRGNGGDVVDMPVNVQPIFNEAGEQVSARVTCCWKLTPEEIAEIVMTGKVYVELLGTPINPVLVHGENPFRT